MLPRVPEHQKAGMGPMEKTRVLDKLPSGVSYGAVGPQLDINESPTHIKQGYVLIGY